MAAPIDQWRVHLLHEELDTLADVATDAIKAGANMTTFTHVCDLIGRARQALHVGALSQSDGLREQAERALIAARHARQEAA